MPWKAAQGGLMWWKGRGVVLGVLSSQEGAEGQMECLQGPWRLGQRGNREKGVPGGSLGGAHVGSLAAEVLYL